MEYLRRRGNLFLFPVLDQHSEGLSISFRLFTQVLQWTYHLALMS
jgi:hypothetical protein